MTAERCNTAVIDRRYKRAESVTLCDLAPIYHVPPRLDVIRPAVLVIQVIGVLPNVDAEQGRVAIHERTVLIWCRSHFEFAALVLDQPGPTAPETFCPCVREFFLEGLEAAEGRLDVVAELSGRLSARIRSHDFPKEGMVRVPAAIVADYAANVFRDGVEILDQVFDRFVRQLRLVFERV